MNIFALLSALILWFHAFIIIVFTIKNWNMPSKEKRIKISEIFYAIAFLINGILLLRIFYYLGAKEQNLIYMIIFMSFSFIVIVFWVFNFLYTWIRINKHPELMDENATLIRNFDKYFEHLEKSYKSHENHKIRDVIRDFSRKALHLVIFAIVIIFYILSNHIQNTLISWNLTPAAFRNLFYIILGFSFIFMFTCEGLVRNNKFETLPDWALKWIGKSLEPSTEKYTFISSLPFLLTLMLLISAPFQIILSACVVSCISDGIASIVGKNWGKHKMIRFGRYPEKTYEGSFAGAFLAFIGIITVFQVIPIPSITVGWQILFGIISAVLFVYIDAYSKFIVDNVLNALLPALIIYIIVLLI